MLGRLRWEAERLTMAVTEALTRATPLPPPAPPSGLDGPLILSLTSYPPRFRTLAPTLRRLMAQSLRPDVLVLWVAKGDLDKLPAEVEALRGARLLIRPCADLGPFKKFVPAVSAYPNAYLVTVDDDVPYRPTMLAELIAGHLANPRAVVAHRARRLKLVGGDPSPYATWEMVREGGDEDDSIVPTGVGGVLYPPGSLREEALDAPTFQTLSSTSDDLWLLWMTRRAGFTSRMVARPREPGSWNGSQAVALWSNVNVGGESRNDASIRALWSRFGPPLRSTHVRH